MPGIQLLRRRGASCRWSKADPELGSFEVAYIVLALLLKNAGKIEHGAMLIIVDRGSNIRTHVCAGGGVAAVFKHSTAKLSSITDF